MINFENQKTTQGLTQRRRASLAAGVFTALGLAFFGLSIYAVFVTQGGRFDLEDKVLMPVTGLMSLLSLASYILIQKDRVALGSGFIFGVSLVPPIIAALMLKNLAPASIGFIAVLASILIFQVLPRAFRREAVVAAVAAVIVIIGIELWNPAFRGSSNVVPNFTAVVITLIVLGLLAFSARWAWSGNLRSQLITSFLMVAIIPLVVTVAVVSYRSFSTQTPLALETQSQIAKRVAEQVKGFILDREKELRSLVDVGDLGNVSLEEQNTLLRNLLSTQSLYDELILVNKYGREVAYVSRLNVVTTENLGHRTGEVEFERPKSTSQTYYSPVAFSEVNGQPYEIIAIPINNLRTGQLAYVLIANFRFKTVWDLMTQADVVGSGSVYMIDDQNRVVAHANPSIALQQKKVTLPAENSFTTGLSGDQQVAMARENIVLNEQTFSVIAEQPSSEALALPINNLVISIIITLGMALLAGFVGVAIANFITNPIGKLSEAAQAISQGNYSQQVVVERQNEIGTLAAAFNSMTAQVSGLIGSLEKRVAERTKALATSSEVSRRLSTILDQKELVNEVVNQVNDAFGYYHTQIYFYDETSNNLVMAGGTGEAGKLMLAQFHKIAKGRGLVGRAAETNEPILVTDTAQNADWLPNPLLPDTKSEVAIPIAIGDKVLGVLDVQHKKVDGLQREDIDSLQSIANQVAIASQNARSYTEVQRSQTLLSDALRAAKLGNWEYDFKNDLFIFTDDFYSIFHTTAEKVGGYKISSADYSKNFVHPDDASLVGAEIQKVLEAKDRHSTTRLEHRIIFSDGEIGYIAVNINVERDEKGNITRWYGANQDITERRSLEEINRKRANQQEAINLITQKIQGTTNIEMALQVTARELGHALGMKSTTIVIDPESLAGDGKNKVSKESVK
jgi:putative methionine-R-sulfoxide reductase with GAF domain